MTRTLQRTVLAVAAVAALASSAEAKDLKMTFASDPMGATVYEEVNGSWRNWGTQPTLTWQLPKKWNTCMQLPTFLFRWASGAETRVAPQACPQVGERQQYTAQRPNVSGVEADIQYAIAMLQAQNAAASVAAAESSAFWSTMAERNRRLRTTCYSRTYYGTSYTNCY